MATYKTLDDYWIRSKGFKELHAKIIHDFKNGLIDEHNYEELVEDLQDELDAARIERQLSSRRGGNGGGA